MSENPTRIGGSEDWITVEVDGKQISLEVVETLDSLARVEAPHAHQAYECHACRALCGQVNLPDGQLEPQCPACGVTGQLGKSTPILRDAAAWFRAEYGVQRFGISAAADLYRLLFSRIEDAKKKRMATAALPTGTESTAPTGAA